MSRNTQPESTVTGAHIAVEGGTVHVLWEDLENARGGNPNAFTFVWRATAPVGGVFSAPIPVDTFQTSFFRAEDATPLIVSGSGRVDAAWTRAQQEQIASEELTSGFGPRNLNVNGFAGNLHAGVDRTGALVLTRANTRQGANNIPFSGRAGRTVLKPGRYVAQIVARDRAGNVSRPAALTFAVVAR